MASPLQRRLAGLLWMSQEVETECKTVNLGWMSVTTEAVMYTKEVVKKVFRELDLNGDGKITADEFSKKEVDTTIAEVACQAYR